MQEADEDEDLGGDDSGVGSDAFKNLGVSELVY